MVTVKQPKVTLVSHTPDPLAVLAWANKNYRGIAYPSIAEARKSMTEKEMVEFVSPLITDPTNTSVEYIQMIFLLENLSRAFQQQITRHRMASFIIHSLRVFDPGNFADEGRYTIPSTVKDKEEFHKLMLQAQNSYRALKDTGNNPEDARGVLPLNLHSTITMRVDLGALRHILRGRLCLVAQEEARKFGYLMKKEVAEKMGDFFGRLLQPPCHMIYGGKCNVPYNYCGVPLWLVSKAPKSFQHWYHEHQGKPDHSRIPTNPTILPEDLEQVELAMKEASAHP